MLPCHAWRLWPNETLAYSLTDPELHIVLTAWKHLVYVSLGPRTTFPRNCVPLSSLRCKEICVIVGYQGLSMSSGVPLMIPHLFSLGPGLAVTMQSCRSTFKHRACVEIPGHSVILMCMWAIRSSKIELTCPVALLLLSLTLPPFHVPRLSWQWGALKTSFVTLPGTPRNGQCSLCFPDLVVCLVTGDEAGSSYSVSVAVTLTSSSVPPRASDSEISSSLRTGPRLWE